MQDTRLNILVSAIAQRSQQWLSNPWRRISMIIISFLFGVFMGTAISTTAGQRATLDIYIAAILTTLAEIISLIFYRRSSMKRGGWVEMINIFKIGFIYSLFIEAFKLGS